MDVRALGSRVSRRRCAALRWWCMESVAQGRHGTRAHRRACSRLRRRLVDPRRSTRVPARWAGRAPLFRTHASARAAHGDRCTALRALATIGGVDVGTAGALAQRPRTRGALGPLAPRLGRARCPTCRMGNTRSGIVDVARTHALQRRPGSRGVARRAARELPRLRAHLLVGGDRKDRRAASCAPRSSSTRPTGTPVTRSGSTISTIPSSWVSPTTRSRSSRP